MIASQKIGKSFSGALRYNINKLFDRNPQRRAELLDTNFASLTASEILNEVNWIRQQRPALSKYVYHTSLNFSPQEQETGGLSNDKLLDIAHDYLKGMSFTNNQYLIFRHHDAGHPHIHLLVNRITFDGKVVSDSNNYKRSEALLRTLEKQYGLIPVTESRFAALNTAPGKVQVFATKRTFERALKKDEIEMAIRKGSASSKMQLQKKLSGILSGPGKPSMQDFIKECQAQGVSLLFNQASTGRISGITYFLEDFKARGQALGSKYKWAEIIKHLDYDQDRDGEIIRQTNTRTKAGYEELSRAESGSTPTGKHQRGRLANTLADASAYADEFPPEQRNGGRAEHPSEGNGGTLSQDATRQEAGSNTKWANDYSDSDTYSKIDIQISDDIDDEAILGRNRRRKKQARTNRR